MLADINFPDFGHVCHIPVFFIFLLMFNELAQYIVSVVFPTSVGYSFLWFTVYCHCNIVVRAPVFHLVRAKSHSFIGHLYFIFVTLAERLYGS
jgi:hypothetical protein